MRRSIVILAAVALLGVLGVYSPVQAGTGSPNDCSGSAWGEWRIPIPTSPVPITLGLAVWNGQSGADQTVRLCYSTSPADWGGQDTTGGSIEVMSDSEWRTKPHSNSVSCTPQSNPSALSPSCYAGTEPTFGYSDGYILHNNETVRFAVPITACFGSCFSQNPSLGPTGVILGSGGPAGGPAGTSTGAGYVVNSLQYCINGGCTGLTPPTYVGAGTDVSAGTTSPGIGYGPGTLACQGLVVVSACIPGAATAHVGGTVAAVQVGSTMIPVTNPAGPVDECVYSWEVVYETAFPGAQIPGPCD